MRTEIIVEVGNSHDGSLGIAKSFVDMAVSAGASTVKFQMHLAQYESSDSDEFRVRFSDQDSTRVEYWNRVSFTPHQWGIISDYCDSKEIEFLCTPFSIEAASILLEVTSIKRWKVGSGDAVNFPLIDFLAESQLPLIISTGLISLDELSLLKERLENLGAWNRTTLMHCVSQYPTPLENSALNMIDELKSFGCNVGLSDHSGQLAPALTAISQGVPLIEVHMTPHSQFFGPDVSSSLKPEEIQFLCNYAQDFNLMMSNPKDKMSLFEDASNVRRLFRKGIYWKENLAAGTKIQYSDLVFLKPCQEIDAMNFEEVIGKVLKNNVHAREAAKTSEFN